MRLPLIALIVLLTTGCIQEAQWTWTGDTPGGDAAADQVTGDGKGEVSPSDVPGGKDTDVDAPKDTTDTIEPKDTTDTVEPLDTADTVDACIPDCDGKDCGEDGCGGSCGECFGSQDLCVDGLCVCQPACEGKECGNDGCGGSCGECPGSQTCILETGVCWEPQCTDGTCLVPEGTFWMGCNEALDGECEEKESPYHQIFLDSFGIDEREVTFGDYTVCVLADICDPPHTDDSLCHVLLDAGWDFGLLPQTFQALDQPAVCLTWEQAEVYCEWSGKRLCTEAEWEKAARGTDGRVYPWGNDEADCQHAVLKEIDAGCGANTTSPTCSKPEGYSPFGVCDMAGNVWEITSDWFDPDYYLSSPAENPQGPADGLYHAIRGGGYPNMKERVRTSVRSNTLYDGGRSHVGFRCCADTELCTPDCNGKECGGDGCGGLCGECPATTCSTGECVAGVCQVDAFYCVVEGACVPSGTENPFDSCQKCQPAVTQLGWSPLEDGLACGVEKRCWQGSCCDYGAFCLDKECGDDSCGGECGECLGAQDLCVEGTCECQPNCLDKVCGADGCGGLCGECLGEQEECLVGVCVCIADCAGKECGVDGCGGTCGECTGPQDLCVGGLCVCQPACIGITCGGDGCGGLCGTCPFGWLCNKQDTCQDVCGDVSGLQQFAPWPTLGYCSTRVGRSPFRAPVDPEIYWCKDTPATSSAPAVDSQGNVYIQVGIDGVQTIGYSQTGELLFDSDVGIKITAPLVTNEGLIVSVGADIVEPDDGMSHLYGLNSEGNVLLDIVMQGTSSATNNYGYGGPAALEGDKLLVTVANWHLSSFQKSGATLWTTDFGALYTPAIGHAGMIYVVGSAGDPPIRSLFSLTQAGATNWAFPLGPSGGYTGSLGGPSVAPDNTIYVAWQTNLHAINPNGTEKWTIEPSPGNKLHHVPPSIGPNGTLYAISTPSGSTSRVLHAVAPTGVVLWSWEAPKYLSSSPTIDAVGDILVACDDGYLYKLSSEGEVVWDLSLNTFWMRNVVVGGPNLLYVAGTKFCAVGEKTP